MESYDVDVITAVHSPTRPIWRAVSSVLDHTRAHVRVTVIAHNIDQRVVVDNLAELAEDPRVRVLELDDGVGSPAGPKNLGFERATASFVSLLDSDDELEPGAIDAWLQLARETSAGAVMARIVGDSSGVDPYPPTRPGRTRDLDPLKDRLIYRSAPLGLVSRERFPDLRLTPGLASGEDLEYTTALWFSGAPVAYARDAPAYVVHEDGDDHVTRVGRSVPDLFAFIGAIRAAPWFPRLTASQRTALGVKILRLHFFPAVLVCLDSDAGIEAHRRDLLDVVHQVHAVAPRALSLLSRADRDVIDALKGGPADADRVRHLLGQRWTMDIPSRIPRNPLLALHRQAPHRTRRAMNQ